MDGVHVHYNSDKPAQLNAQAYAQGTDIHLARGQEKHLPHEAWHVVQQRQGRVKPTRQMKGEVYINDDSGLENEADAMGQKALQLKQAGALFYAIPPTSSSAKGLGIFSCGGQIAQLRTLKLGKKSIKNLQGAMKVSEFRDAINALKERYDEEKVDYLASQLFSASGETIDGMEQFVIELEYDLQTKSGRSGPLTLQERYLTEYGWKRAMHKPSEAIPDSSSEPVLKLFRTMSIEDWKELNKGNYKVLQGGHIGDFKQALKYFLGKSSDTKVLVEFTLKPGAETQLFHPQKMGLPSKSERSEKLKTMATVVGGDSFPLANKDQGYSDTAIGVKSEAEGEAGFSFGIGGGATPELFQGLVDKISIKQIGNKFVQEKGSSKKQVSEDSSEIESDASRLLHVNNCLINAIANAALGRNANLGELVQIRSVLDNYGEMLVASPEVVNLIRQALQIDNAITIVYSGEIPSEDFDGTGPNLIIYHVGGNHFTDEPPD